MTDNIVFEALVKRFLQTPDREALAALAQDAPVATSDNFLESVDDIIETALKMGEYDTAEALRQRVDAMKEIRAMLVYQRQDALTKAVIAFVQAGDEATARQTFAKHRALLDSDEAVAMLAEQFDPRDNKAHGHLRRRAQLLQDLRGA